MKNKGIYLILAIMLALVSCKTNSKNTASDIKAEVLDFDFYSARSKIKINKKGMDYSILMNLRIQNNQLIWINLSNTVVGKIGRCKITPDSVFVLRDYQVREYYKGSISALNSRIGYELSYAMVQKILLGEMPLLDLDSATVKKDNGELLIVQKEPKFTLENHLDPKTKKLNSVKLYQNGKTEYLELIYSEYEKVNGRLIPKVIELKSNAQNDFFSDVKEMKIKYLSNKFTVDTLNFPFKVSSKYEHKTL
jgi:hypothetical protein